MESRIKTDQYLMKELETEAIRAYKHLLPSKKPLEAQSRFILAED